MDELFIENQPVLSKIIKLVNETEKSSQAYLLVGQSKSDLELYSLLFSKVLICPSKYDSTCSKCNICKRIDENEYNELKIINPVNRVIKKDVIINVRNTFQTNPIEGKNQIYIIKDAESLNSSSANSILKFLEEPDSDTIAIFTTTNLDRVIDTIISRCQIIKINNTSCNDDNYIKNISGFDDEKISIVLNLFEGLEITGETPFLLLNNDFIPAFNDRELLQSALTILMLAYKDTLNYKIFNKLSYFSNAQSIKTVAQKQGIEIIIKKISFILENMNKLEYNINILLFMNNLLIGIGEILDDKGNRN